MTLPFKRMSQLTNVHWLPKEDKVALTVRHGVQFERHTVDIAAMERRYPHIRQALRCHQQLVNQRRSNQLMWSFWEQKMPKEATSHVWFLNGNVYRWDEWINILMSPNDECTLWFQTMWGFDQVRVSRDMLDCNHPGILKYMDGLSELEDDRANLVALVKKGWNASYSTPVLPAGFCI